MIWNYTAYLFDRFIAAFNADEMSSDERAMRARAFMDRMENLVCEL